MYMNYNVVKDAVCQGGYFMLFSDYITIKEAAEKWGVSTRAITYHVVAGRIPGVIKIGNMWLIPATAPKPEDLRKYNYRRQPKKKEDAEQ